MNGKVKICKKTTNDEIDSINYYDIDGKITKKEDYRDNKPWLIYIYKYEKNIKIEEILNLEGKLVNRHEEIFNDIGQIKKSIIGIEKVLKHFHYEYDDNQKISLLTISDSSNNIISKEFHQYIDNSEHIKKFNSKGTLESLTILNHNEKGQLIRIIDFENTDYKSEINYQSNNFDEYFKMMEAFNYNLTGQKNEIDLSIHFLKSDTVFEYDKFGNQTLRQENQFREDFSSTHLTLKNQEIQEYDENNLLIKSSYYEIHTDWDDEHICNYTYSLNDQRLVTEKTTKTLFKIIIEKFDYNSNSKLIYQKEEHNNSEYTKEIFFDDFGNKTLEISRYNFEDEESEEINTKYEIDYY